MSEIWYDIALITPEDLNTRLDLIVKRPTRHIGVAPHDDPFTYHYIRGYTAGSVGIPECFDRFTGRVVAFRRAESLDAKRSYDGRRQ